MLVFLRVYVCVKAKLTFVSFFFLFFVHLSLSANQWERNPVKILCALSAEHTVHWSEHRWWLWGYWKRTAHSIQNYSFNNIFWKMLNRPYLGGVGLVKVWKCESVKEWKCERVFSYWERVSHIVKVWNFSFWERGTLTLCDEAKDAFVQLWKSCQYKCKRNGPKRKPQSKRNAEEILHFRHQHEILKYPSPRNGLLAPHQMHHQPVSFLHFDCNWK